MLLPKSIAGIGDNAFTGCTNLTKIYINREEPPFIEKRTFYRTNGELVIYVPKGCKERYKNSETWRTFNIIEMECRIRKRICMEIASLVISILSIVISAIVAGIPFYRKYIEKKTKIALIACDGIIRDDMIRIVVTYVNKNWQNAVIINSHINLYHPKLLNEFTKVNHAYSCKSFNPVVITEKMHASIELEYSLSELKEVDLENADVYVYVHTEYIDSQGQRLFDNHRIETCA